MNNNKNDIFQSLADKLEEKEFNFEPSHWEAAEKMIPSSNGFSSLKWAAGIGSAAVIVSLLSYNYLSQPVIETKSIEIKEVVTFVESVRKINLQYSEITEEKIEVTKTELKITPIESAPQVEIKKAETTPTIEEKITLPVLKKIILTEIETPKNKQLEEEEYFEFEPLSNEEIVVEIAEINQQIEINIPNVFTPNGDGTNDFFSIQNLKGENWGLIIYNKSSEIVYESNQYKNQWNGQNLEDGNYFYKLHNSKINLFKEGIIKLKR